MVSPFCPLIPPQPRVFSRFPRPIHCQPLTTHFPPPFIFITLQIPSHRPSIKISFAFTSLRTPFSVTPLFSHPYKTPGGVGVFLSGCSEVTGHESQVTSFHLVAASFALSPPSSAQPESSRVAQCAALAVEEAPAGDSGKRGGACPRPQRTLRVHRCRCFFSPATHTEPPAGVLAGLQVAAMPTRNSSTLPTGRPYFQLCVPCASVASPAFVRAFRLARKKPQGYADCALRYRWLFTAGGPSASARRPPACHPPGPPRTRWRSRSKTPTAAHRSQRNSCRRSAPS